MSKVDEFNRQVSTENDYLASDTTRFTPYIFQIVYKIH